MAKNWSVAEALQVITAGKNLGAIKDIGRRFPLFLFFVLHNPLKIIEAFGLRVTARTVNKQLEGHLKYGGEKDIKPESWVDVKPKSKESKKKKKKEGKALKDDESKVEGAKEVIIEGVAKKADEEVMGSKEGKEEAEGKKIKEDDIDNLDFDVEDLLEESED